MGDSDSDSSEILHIRKQRRVSGLLSSSDENTRDDTEEDCSSEDESQENFSFSISKLDDEPSDDTQSEEENQTKNSEWETEENNRAPFDFSGNSGQQFDVLRSSRGKCLFYLDKFLDNEFISVILEQINLYIQQYLEDHNLKPRSRMKNWYSTNYNEMRCFIAMLILQAIIRKPTLQSYFSKRESVSTPFFSKVFTTERFLHLCKLLHIVDNRNLITTSKISKIESIVKNIQHKCKSLYIFQSKIFVLMNAYYYGKDVCHGNNTFLLKGEVM